MEEQTNIEEVDLSEHRWDGSWAWFDEACKDFGLTTAIGMGQYMESIAPHLNVGMYIDIPGICHNEKKIPYAVKIACVIIETARRFVNGLNLDELAQVWKITKDRRL